MPSAVPSFPVIPDSAPFTVEQRAWLNGFIAGVMAQASLVAAHAAAPALPLMILFGSQTGTAEGLAKRAAKAASQRGFAPRVVDMAQTSLTALADEARLLVITSTHGDGESPDNAKALHGALTASGAPPLGQTRYSVCGLGDTNYTHFCQAAKDFDIGLEKLGATRVHPRVDCDLEYEPAFTAWLDATLGTFGTAATALRTAATEATEIVGHSRKNPFPATLLASEGVTLPGSAKQVHHVELSLVGSGLHYEAGDALGVWPENDPELVREVLAAMGCDGEEEVTVRDGSATSLRNALTRSCDLGRPSPELAARFPATPMAEENGKPVGIPHYLLDLLTVHSRVRIPPAELVSLLRPLSPRLYSISSSPRAHDGQVHLTVATVRYPAHGRQRHGVCSTYLADRVEPGQSKVRVFIHTNTAFRLPADPDTPIIMVGPGTGIAPFRSFLHQRRAQGSRGKAWLFFGDQHAATDFLYRDELEAFQKDGTLTRLDTAFSRDQAEKVYVQHRMRDRALELYVWLEAGAHVYVCGDASRMAKDVDEALHQVISAATACSPSSAAEYVQKLRSAKRYCRDVY